MISSETLAKIQGKVDAVQAADVEAARLARSPATDWLDDAARFRAEENSRLSHKLALAIVEHATRIVQAGDEDAALAWVANTSIGSSEGVSAEEKMADPITELSTVAGDTAADLKRKAESLALPTLAIGGGLAILAGLAAIFVLFGRRSR